MNAFVFLADGFEETEAIAPIDVMRRAGFNVVTVSIMGRKQVKGSHGINVEADALFEQTDFSAAGMLVLPGGMPGTKNLAAHEGLAKLLTAAAGKDVILGAICAAPSVYGGLGLLKGEKATCYPGFEEYLTGAEVKKEPVVVSNQFVTSRGAGTAMRFGLALVAKVKGQSFADELAAAMEFK
ncbi:MAG: DJ-1/PfpI family protein [Paludibacteraceae bacterium]|nr:DJ-1/PfpI family protein [Paludibacteraceae bacterium]